MERAKDLAAKTVLIDDEAKEFEAARLRYEDRDRVDRNRKDGAVRPRPGGSLQRVLVRAGNGHLDQADLARCRSAGWTNSCIDSGGREETSAGCRGPPRRWCRCTQVATSRAGPFSTPA